DVALEDQRPPRDAADRAVGDLLVVAHQLPLGDAGLREVDLVGVRDRDLAPRELDDLGLGARHAPSLVAFAPARAEHERDARAGVRDLRDAVAPGPLRG